MFSLWFRQFPSGQPANVQLQMCWGPGTIRSGRRTKATKDLLHQDLRQAARRTAWISWVESSWELPCACGILCLCWKPIQSPHPKKKSGQTMSQAKKQWQWATAPNQISHFLLKMFFSDSSSSSKAFSAANRSSFAFSAGCDGPLSGCLKHSSQDQFLFLPTN